jgi:lysyl-tRNA synthetase class 2
MMIAGFDRVYEFSRNFRPGNSSDEKHNSEFTSLECNQIGASFRDMMTLTEAILSFSIALIKGTTKVTVDDKKFDVNTPWNRISVQAALLAETGVDVLTIESVQ